MELLIAASIISFSVGAILGIATVSRHYELELEQAYLSGHVDGYIAAEDDLSLHREGDRLIGEQDG